MTLEKKLLSQGEFLFRYRSYLPIIYLLLQVLFMYYTYDTQSISNTLNISCSALQRLSLIIGLLGLTIRCLTIGYTPKGTSGRNTKCQRADSLNTDGTYSIVRHPLYIGNFFIVLGIAALSDSFLFIVFYTLLFIAYYKRVILCEEKYLENKFQKEFIKWANLTNIIIPKLRNFRKPTVSFNWKKVLRQEKNGFTAFFLLFYLYSYSLCYSHRSSPSSLQGPLSFCAIFSIISYIILRFLKKHSSLLN